MPERLSFRLWNPVQAHKEFQTAWIHAKALLLAGHKLVLKIDPETRSTEQNARLWSLLSDVSDQVDWYGRKLDPESWKHIFTSSLRKLDVVPNLDGNGFVALGLSTRKMTKSEMSDLQTLIESFGADKGVKFKAFDS